MPAETGVESAAGTRVDGPTATVSRVITAAEGEAPQAGEEELARGTAVGRYFVLGKVGSGGMGTVYAAYDPELERKVALKLLHSKQGSVEARLRERQRLLREAQALARLSHPNVLTVHDVGSVGDRVFVATELVEGMSLRDWLAAPPRSRREILRAFGEAGRGLAAAHAAGLVHRDFKPGNVMVGRDGRVLVVDFGLARGHDKAGEGGLVSLGELDGATALPADLGGGPTLSHTVGVLGTPTYMAPEQRAGKPAGPAADQFAYCVALYEALYGELPFVRSAPGEGWAVRPVPAGSRVPIRLRRVLLRGLVPEPGDRYPSLTVLLAELAREPLRLRVRWLAATAAGVLALAGLALRQSAERPDEVCRGGEDRMAEVWGPERREDLRQAFLAGERPYADEASRAASRALDRYAEQWVAMYSDACAATHFRGDQSTGLLDLRMACLDRRREEASALVDLLLTTAASDPGRAVEAVMSLPPVDRCADSQALLAPMAPPSSEEGRERVAALSRRLAEARALRELGRYEVGKEVARAAVGDAEASGYWPVTAEALLELGLLEERSADPAGAETLRRAAEAAAAGGHVRVAAAAFTRLVRVFAYEKVEHPRARQYSGLAGAALERLGRPAELEAELADHLGRLAFQEADYGTALERHLHALELKRRVFGAQHPEVAASLLRIANVRAEQGAFEEAEAAARQAIADYEAALGPSHPQVAVALLALGSVLHRRGDLEAALEPCRRALAISEASLGRRNSRVADARLQLGGVLSDLRRLDEALGHYQAAREILESQLGASHPRLAQVLSAVASVHLDRGEIAPSLDLYRRALAIQEAAYGGGHPWVALTLYNLGAASKKLGDFRASRGYFERSLSLWEKVHGREHYLVAHALTGLGQALNELGLAAEAVAHLERALAIRLAQAGDPVLLANTRFALARALASSGGDRRRARELALAAEQSFRQAGTKTEHELTEVERWLATGSTGGST